MASKISSIILILSALVTIFVVPSSATARQLLEKEKEGTLIPIEPDPVPFRPLPFPGRQPCRCHCPINQAHCRCPLYCRSVPGTPVSHPLLPAPPLPLPSPPLPGPTPPTKGWQCRNKHHCTPLAP